MIEDILGSNILSGFFGFDILVIGVGDDFIIGGDIFEIGDDSIVVGVGNDIIFGCGGRDIIFGGVGNDYIVLGFKGIGDLLIGGEGNDSFVFFVVNNDIKLSVIVDFDVIDDWILFSDVGFNLVNFKVG